MPRTRSPHAGASPRGRLDVCCASHVLEVERVVAVVARAHTHAHGLRASPWGRRGAMSDGHGGYGDEPLYSVLFIAHRWSRVAFA